MSNTNTNGHVQRKTLASQLDRLDNTIDALADGLNRFVADAVREVITAAVPQAVEMVLRQVLTHPELLRQLAGQVNPTPITPASAETARGPSVLYRAWNWICTRLRSVSGWVRAKASYAGTAIREKVHRLPATIRTKVVNAGLTLIEKLRWLRRNVRELGSKVWEHRRPVTLSLLIGLSVGSIGYLGGPVLSSLALGLCSSGMSLAGFLAAPFVRLWKQLCPEAE